MRLPWLGLNSTAYGATSNVPLKSCCSGRMTVATRSVQLPTGSASTISGRAVVLELADRFRQLVEIAAEASAGHFADVEALGPQAVGIDQVGRLVVGDDADFLAAALIVTSQAGDGGCFAGAEKAAEHDEADGGHRSQRSGVRGQE